MSNPTITVLGVVIDLPLSTALHGTAREDALRLEDSAGHLAARGDFATADSAERLVAALAAR